MTQVAKFLNHTLGSVYSLYEHPGRIGLEFEVEGTNIAPWTDVWWMAKPDNSLRNGGYEWILKKPLMLDNALKAVNNWFEKKKHYQMETPFSIRTSIHVHVNAVNYTLKQIYQVITAYWLVEDLLCKFSGPTREGNLFCLRVRDADYAMSKLCEGLTNGSFFYGVNSDEFKYGALNLQALLKYGSFEFRMMRGMYDDPDFIKQWIIALSDLVTNAAIKYDNPKQVLKAFEKDRYKFLNELFGLSFAMKLRQHHPEWEEMMEEHYHHAFELVTTPETWDTDESVSPSEAHKAVYKNQFKGKKPKHMWKTSPSLEEEEQEQDWQNTDELLESLEAPPEEDF